ncbi:ATP-binding cassette domain-containing protein [Desulfovibrio litoralis]|uniref:ATP-binding protein Uup n=1 Tax=Desulfovibrio litoralis DSM 11393 TaxID=1121455 RepID=A0A1M7RSE2_9BACT|nr:ATP-binding cassette domain-containing protein [Desulfovibrio litoralis]SHN49111.1 ATP-binding cassette, subfamily F, uup [Desulfovibrio litoralis DSM 11393]
MSLLNLHGISLNLGGKTILDNVDFAVEPGERVCLMGRNGAGKSSLLALLGGKLKADSGTIIRDCPILGQMPQDVPQAWTGSVLKVVSSVLGEEGQALNAAHLFSTGKEKELNPQEFKTAQKLLEQGHAWERYGDVLSIINHLDLNPDADFSSLSGGTKRRVALAGALLCSNDLLLDEPTNHLDLSTITWLEDFLLRKARTLVFISHDRAFAQRLATRMVEIDRGKLYSYGCGFAQYTEKREERLEIEERHFALFDKKLAQEEVWIRQGVKARRTRNMGRVRALEKMRSERRIRREKQGNVHLFAQEAERSGKLVIEANEVSFAYPNQTPLFQNFSTVIQRGDKIGLIGQNGVGKSTLLRLLLGELKPTSGSIRLGTQLEISYFDQLRASLNPEESVMESVAEGNDVVTIGGNTRHVAGYLQDFLFTPDRLRLPVKVLSGGERNRLLLAKLFTRPSNLLVLDEPTNDLDMETLELLEELISDYSGTVIMVSHDRSFLDNLVTSVLALEGDGQVHEYVGAYTDWLRQRSQQETIEKNNIQATKTSVSENSAPQKPKKLSFKEQREIETLRKELSELPQRLTALEETQKTLELKLSDPSFFSQNPDEFASIAKQLEKLESEQTKILEKWEALEKRLEALGVEG